MSLKNFKEIETNKVEMNIVISHDAFENAVNKVFAKSRKSIAIPGFRKGKATRGLVEKFYGKQVFYEDAINDLLPEEIDTDVKETSFRMAAMPEVTDVDFEAEEGVTATVTFIRYPDVKVASYKGLAVEKIVIQTEDSEVDAELERTRARYARTIEVTDRAAAKDDTVTIDYEGFCDGVAFEGGKADGHKLKLGSNTFIPGFEDQIVGKSIGEEFDVNVKFPEEYHAKELAGKDATFKCKLNAIEYEELPALDDDFAKDASEFETFAEYKADIKAKIEKRHNAEAEVRLADELSKALGAQVEAEIPDALVDKEKENLVREYDYQLRSQGLSLDMILQYTGMTLDDIRARYADVALVNVKKQLALEEIVKAEAIEASDEEVEAKYNEMAEQFGMKAEEIKKRISAEDLAYDVKSIKAFELVKETAEIDEKTMTTEEFEKLNAPAEEEEKAEEAEEEKPKRKTAKKAKTEDASEEEKPKKTRVKKTAETENTEE